MLKEVLKHVKTVAIGGHVRPDGDCVGSCLGLYQYIKENYEEIQADVYLEDIPDSFQFITRCRTKKNTICLLCLTVVIKNVSDFQRRFLNMQKRRSA